MGFALLNKTLFIYYVNIFNLEKDISYNYPLISSIGRRTLHRFKLRTVCSRVSVHVCGGLILPSGFNCTHRGPRKVAELLSCILERLLPPMPEQPSLSFHV